MSGVKDITPDLDKLDTQLDTLEDALAPLLKNLNEKASQLPLLDRAKLFSLTAYSIESLLFCKHSLLCLMPITLY
jgi:exosome complex protein LRP1